MVLVVRSDQTNDRSLGMISKGSHALTGYRLHLRVPENLYYFEGHFPHVAIVAGVCLLKWVIDYIETYSGNPVQMVAMEAVKFHRPLLPRQQFSIEFSYDRQASAWHYDVVANDKPCASGRFIVHP